MDKSDPLDMAGFEKERERARKRETDRNAIREPVKAALSAINEAEHEAAARDTSYSHRLKLVESRVQLVSLLSELEGESSSFYERTLLSTGD